MDIIRIVVFSFISTIVVSITAAIIYILYLEAANDSHRDI